MGHRRTGHGPCRFASALRPAHVLLAGRYRSFAASPASLLCPGSEWPRSASRWPLSTSGRSRERSETGPEKVSQNRGFPVSALRTFRSFRWSPRTGANGPCLPSSRNYRRCGAARDTRLSLHLLIPPSFELTHGGQSGPVHLLHRPVRACVIVSGYAALRLWRCSEYSKTSL